MKFLEKVATYLCSVISFSSENRAVYEIMWKYVVERSRPQMTIWRMRIACWTPKATNTQSKSVINIAFSTAIIDARPRFIVTLYVCCLSFSWYCKVHTKCWLQIPNPSLWGMLRQLIVLLLSLSGTTCIEHFRSKISGNIRTFEGPTKETKIEYQGFLLG
jgi:hypothetical protein